MDSLLLATATAVDLFCATSTADATQFVIWGPRAPDGAFSGVFGNEGVAADIDGAFSDTFNFSLPTGVSSFVATSTFSSSPDDDIDFTSIKFNDANFSLGFTWRNQHRFLNSIPVTLGGPQQLIVVGTTGGNGAYSGVISFTPTQGAVPEPSAWALMILGFGRAGAMHRRCGRGIRFDAARTHASL